MCDLRSLDFHQIRLEFLYSCIYHHFIDITNTSIPKKQSLAISITQVGQQFKILSNLDLFNIQVLIQSRKSMMKMKQKITVGLQNNYLSCFPSDRYTLNKSASVKNSSKDQMYLPKSCTKSLNHHSSRIILKPKDEPLDPEYKKQCYFQTENEMIQQNKRQVEKELKVNVLNGFGGAPNYNLYQSITTTQICRLFVYKLKRNMKNRRIGLLQQRLFQLQNSTIESVAICRTLRFSRVVSVVWKLVVLMQFMTFSISSAFQNFSQLKLLLVLRLIGAIMFIMKQVSENILQSSKNFNYISYFTSPSLNKASFLISIISITFWFNSNFNYLMYLDLFYCLFCFQVATIFQQFLVEFIVRRKILRLFQHLAIVKIIAKMIIFSHVTTIILVKLYFYNLQNNWLVGSKQLSSPEFPEIYNWSFKEAISIIFTFGFYMPSSTNSNESIIFTCMRVSNFIFALINIREFLSHCFAVYHKRQNCQHSILLAAKTIAQKSQMKDDEYDSLVDFMKVKMREIKCNEISNQKQVAIITNHLPQKNQSAINNERFMSRIKPFSLIFPGLSPKTIVKLAQSMIVESFCKNQILKDFNSSYDFFILKEGQIAHTRPNCNTLITQRQQVNQNNMLLLNNSFMRRTFPKYKLKFLSSSIIFRLREQDFREIIKESRSDHQYIWTLYDSAKWFQNQINTFRCKICYQSHSQFQCPSMHYTPFTSHIIWKYLEKKMKHKKKHFPDNQRIPRLQYSALLLYSNHLNAQHTKKASFLEPFICHKETESLKDISLELDSFIQSISTRLFQKSVQMQVEKDEIWTLKLDLLYNYKRYFKSFNPNNLKGLMFERQHDFL